MLVNVCIVRIRGRGGAGVAYGLQVVGGLGPPSSPPRRRSRARSVAPSHWGPLATIVDRPPSSARSPDATAIARAALGRRRRSPAVTRWFARRSSPAIAGPPLILLVLVLVFKCFL